MKKRIDDMEKENQKAQEEKKRNSNCFKVEDFHTNSVRRMSMMIKNIDIQKN